MRFAITLFLAVAIGGLSHADQIAIIRADLPGPIPHEAPIALQGLREGIVLLDLRIAPELEPSHGEGADRTVIAAPEVSIAAATPAAATSSSTRLSSADTGARRSTLAAAAC